MTTPPAARNPAPNRAMRLPRLPSIWRAMKTIGPRLFFTTLMMSGSSKDLLQLAPREKIRAYVAFECFPLVAIVSMRWNQEIISIQQDDGGDNAF